MLTQRIHSTHHEHASLCVFDSALLCNFVTGEWASINSKLNSKTLNPKYGTRFVVDCAWRTSEGQQKRMVEMHLEMQVFCLAAETPKIGCCAYSV